MGILFLVFQATPKSYLDDRFSSQPHLVDIRLVWSIKPSASRSSAGPLAWRVSST